MDEDARPEGESPRHQSYTPWKFLSSTIHWKKIIFYEMHIPQLDYLSILLGFLSLIQSHHDFVAGGRYQISIKGFGSNCRSLVPNNFKLLHNHCPQMHALLLSTGVNTYQPGFELQAVLASSLHNDKVLDMMIDIIMICSYNSVCPHWRHTTRVVCHIGLQLVDFIQLWPCKLVENDKNWLFLV